MQLLSDLIKTAKDGDTILLDGGDYGYQTIANAKFKNLTIRSKDKDNPAVFDRLDIAYSTGITIEEIEGYNQSGLDYLVTRKHCFYVYQCDDVWHRKSKFHGSADPARRAETGLVFIRECTNSGITECEVYHARYGISDYLCGSVTANDNYVHDIRTDGMRGFRSDMVTWKRNLVCSVFPAPGDHMDGMQRGSQGATRPADNIVISENIVSRGNGVGTPPQGIFTKDEAKKPYTNLFITDNLATGCLNNGISVEGAASGQLNDNVVAQWPDQTSALRWQVTLPGVEVLRNRCTAFYRPDGGSVLRVPPGNSKIAPVTDKGEALIREFLAKHPGWGARWGDTEQILALCGITVANAPAPAPTPAPAPGQDPAPGEGTNQPIPPTEEQPDNGDNDDGPAAPGDTGGEAPEHGGDGDGEEQQQETEGDAENGVDGGDGAEDPPVAEEEADDDIGKFFTEAEIAALDRRYARKG